MEESSSLVGYHDNFIVTRVGVGVEVGDGDLLLTLSLGLLLTLSLGLLLTLSLGLLLTLSLGLLLTLALGLLLTLALTDAPP